MRHIYIYCARSTLPDPIAPNGRCRYRTSRCGQSCRSPCRGHSRILIGRNRGRNRPHPPCHCRSPLARGAPEPLQQCGPRSEVVQVRHLPGEPVSAELAAPFGHFQVRLDVETNRTLGGGPAWNGQPHQFLECRGIDTGGTGPSAEPCPLSLIWNRLMIVFGRSWQRAGNAMSPGNMPASVLRLHISA